MSARGAYDFETWDWTNPLCCGFVWGPVGLRESEFIHDKSGKRPLDVAKAALGFMHRMASRDAVTEWWAHNGGKFDVLFLVQTAHDLGWEFSAVCTGSRAIRVEFLAPDGIKFRCQDSYALIQSKLASVAKDFECPSSKLFTAEDYATDPRTWDVKRLRDGCLIDCHIVLEALERVETQAEQWGGKLGLTFSSTALSVMRASVGDFPSHGEKFRHAHQIANAARKGGRVEVFHHAPPTPLVEFDIASSYPWAMSQSLPWLPLGIAKNASGKQKVLDGVYEGFVDAEVRVDGQAIPPLPMKHEGALYFPTGRFRDWFAACELRYAAKHGARILKVHDATAYQPATPFRDIIAELYSLKATAKGAVRQFVKLVLNGAYGKLAQGSDTEQIVCFSDDDAAHEFVLSKPPGRVSRVGFSSRVLTERQTRMPKHTHFAAAAYVLALARMRLHEGLVGSTNPAYSDTDSIHCESGVNIPEHLLGDDLGQFKVEAEGYRARFFAPKLYEMIFPDGKGHYASKGFPVGRDEFATVSSGERLTLHRIRPLKSQMARGEGVRRIKEEKRWHGGSSKRYNYPDGSTRPWTVQEILDGKPDEEYSPLYDRSKEDA